ADRRRRSAGRGTEHRAPRRLGTGTAREGPRRRRHRRRAGRTPRVQSHPTPSLGREDRDGRLRRIAPGEIMKRVLVFIGTRPEAIKMAPVYHALKAAPEFEPVVVSTGQHREMLQQVTDLFQIDVAHSLDVMQPNQTLAGLTARLL